MKKLTLLNVANLCDRNNIELKHVFIYVEYDGNDKINIRSARYEVEKAMGPGWIPTDLEEC